MRRETLKAFDVDFFENPQLIRFNYLDYKDVERVVFFSRLDFFDWIHENKYLTVSEEYFDLWANPNSSPKISPDDFFNMGQFYIYLIRLARIFFSERVATWDEDLIF